MSTEINFTKLLDQFKKDAQEIVGEVIDTIHGDLLPSVEDDTAMNVEFRLNEVVNRIIAGMFTVEEGGDWINVSVNQYVNIRLDPEPWNKAVDVLSEKFSDTAKDMKIKRLEAELKESYKRY